MIKVLNNATGNQPRMEICRENQAPTQTSLFLPCETPQHRKG